jgi:hypothetical protein
MDRKNLGALVVGLLPGHGEVKPEEKDHGGKGPVELERSPEELKALHDEAIDDVFDALKSGNRESFREAFSAAVRVCKMAEEEGLYEDGAEGEE